MTDQQLQQRFQLLDLYVHRVRNVPGAVQVFMWDEQEPPNSPARDQILARARSAGVHVKQTFEDRAVRPEGKPADGFRIWL